MLSAVMCGPKIVARKVPPTRWPLMPPTIGKFNIWATKTSELKTASVEENFD